MSEQEKIVHGAATDADVQNLMNTAMSLASAGVMNMTPRSETGATTLHGEFRITNDNTFERYAQISVISPHTFIPLIKLGLSTVSGMKLEIEVGIGNEVLLKKMEKWAEFIGLNNKVQNIARCLIRDGTTIASLGREPVKKPDEEFRDALPKGGITAIDVLPMQYMTLITDAETLGDMKSEHLIKGTPNRAILYEAKKTKVKGLIEFKREEFALFRLFNEGYFMDDVIGRPTYGIYGASLVEPIIRSVKGLLDLTEGFGAYMRRYGIDRLNINIPIVEELRIEGRYEEAKEILEDTIASMRKLGAHEDMVSGNSDVQSISKGTVPSVRDMKESFESDIQVGLLQSPLTMGRAVGTTYASGFLSEADRMMILESIQIIILSVVQAEIINPQLKSMGAKHGAIKVTANDLTNPLLDPQSLTDARINGDITEEEYRERMGFPAEKPQSTGPGTPAGEGGAADDEDDTED